MKQSLQLKFESKGNGQNVVFSHGTPTYSGEYENVPLENVGHFVADESPTIVADELDSFLRKIK